MTPDAVVACVAEIVAPRATFDEEDIYAALTEAGIPGDVAHRAYSFTQIAWGRAFLDGLRIQFSPDYLCFNSAGEVIEAGRLEEEPYFVAASRLAGQYARSPGFTRCVLMSADVNVINDRLLAGSKAEDLATGAAGLFMESPTPSGLDKAKETIRGRLAALRTPTKESRDARTKPWWRFWR